VKSGQVRSAWVWYYIHIKIIIFSAGMFSIGVLIIFLLSLIGVQLAKVDQKIIEDILLEAQHELDQERSGNEFDSIPGHVQFVNSER
jgi:hypothetical protein